MKLTCIHTGISNAFIHHHMDHSNLLPLLSVTVGTWLPPSAIHSLNSLILVYTHCIIIVNLYYCEKELYQLEDSVYAVSFAFHLKNSFPKLLRLEPFPPTPSIRLFHTFVIVRLLSHRAFSEGMPKLPTWNFKFCIRSDSLFVLQRAMGFDKCILSCLHQYCITQNSFTTLKIPCASSINPPTLPHPPGNRWSF